LTVEQGAEKNSGWKKFLKKHWNIAAIFVAAGIGAIIASVYVFLWFVGNAQSTGLVPATLGMWTMGNMISFILHGIFWELLLIGIPVAVAGTLGWQWWKRLPKEETSNLSWKQSKSSRAGEAISPLLFIAFAIKVYIDGNWNVAISTWKLDYVVGSVVTILIWIAAIAAIPAILALFLWLIFGRNKKP
jgi:hypothetical protein